MTIRRDRPLKKAIAIATVIALVVAATVFALIAMVVLPLFPSHVTLRCVDHITGISFPAGTRILRSSLDRWQQTLLYVQVETSGEWVDRLPYSLPPWIVQIDGSPDELLAGLPLDWRPDKNAKSVRAYAGQASCGQRFRTIDARVFSWTAPTGSRVVLVEWVER